MATSPCGWYWPMMVPTTLAHFWYFASCVSRWSLYIPKTMRRCTGFRPSRTSCSGAGTPSPPPPPPSGARRRLRGGGLLPPPPLKSSSSCCAALRAVDLFIAGALRSSRIGPEQVFSPSRERDGRSRRRQFPDGEIALVRDVDGSTAAVARDPERRVEARRAADAVGEARSRHVPRDGDHRIVF